MANNENTRAPAGGSDGWHDPERLKAWDEAGERVRREEEGGAAAPRQALTVAQTNAIAATAYKRVFGRALIEESFDASGYQTFAREVLASAPASAPLPLTDDRIVDCAVSAGLHDEMWFGQDTPKGYEDCMPKLRAFARLITRMNALPQPPRTPMKTDTSREAFEAWAYQVENFSSRLERMEDWRAFEAALWTAWNEAWQESRKQALAEVLRLCEEHAYDNSTHYLEQNIKALADS